MKDFIARHAEKVIGVLSGFDRLVLRGTLRNLAFVAGLMSFLYRRHVLLKDFGQYAQRMTDQLKEASLEAARRQDRPIEYLASAQASKEAIARKIAARDGIHSGLIGVLTSVEPCMTYEIYRNREKKKLEVVPRRRKCLFLYHYFEDPVFGFMNARIQTWFPFSIQICLNGREWLAKQMREAGIRYRREDNCFPRIQDVAAAQNLMDQQLRVSWPRLLDGLALRLNPAHPKMYGGEPLRYYWSAYQSEWASDIMFRDAASLAEIYPTLVRHGIMSFSSPDVMRFLGQKPHGNLRKEVTSSFRHRVEGVRVKHWLGHNSIKIYDKHGSILRIETTIHDRRGFKVFRAPEGKPNEQKRWMPMRAGIADLRRRAQVSQAANDRYTEALSKVTSSTPLGDLVGKVCEPIRHQGKRARGLRPWTQQDVRLLEAVNRGEFTLNGFRNRDLRALLYDGSISSKEEARRRSARVSRLLRLLRAHGLVQKIQHTHRYKLTASGQAIIPAILAAQHATLDQLNKVA